MIMLEREEHYRPLAHGEEYTFPGFDLSRVIGMGQGQIIEIGGPTPSGYEVLGDNSVRPELNITIEPTNSDIPERIGDGRHTGLSSNSCRIILASCLPKREIHHTDEGTFFGTPVRPAIIKEAGRLLTTYGLLVWQGSSEDIDAMKRAGLTIMHSRTRKVEFEVPFQRRITDGTTYEYDEVAEDTLCSVIAQKLPNEDQFKSELQY